jgi:3-methyladenine DNA glycosylase AlkD
MMMELAEVMQQLESLGRESHRKTYARHGITEPMFGVSYADFKIIVKKIKKNHNLAIQLWETGNYDARILATMIADPKQLSLEHIDAWVKQLTHYAITDAFAGMVANSPHVQSKMAVWVEADNEWICCAGWNLLAHLALEHPDLPDEFFHTYLTTIQNHIHEGKNRVRYNMNNALIAIGRRNDALQAKALAIAKIIGKVEVDHGPTWCKTPSAEEYILRQRPERKKA